MKQFILPTLLLFGLLTKMQAQNCKPDPTGIPDTAFGVFPLPYIAEDRPKGGINDTVCLNRDFDFTFTIKIGSTLTLLGQPATITSVSIATTGAVTYDPALPGFSYVCNPPNCVFLAKDTFGCVKIIGKTANPALVGKHALKINGTIKASVGGFPATDFPVSFPNASIPELRGEYSLFVQEANSPFCTASPTYSVYAPDIELNNRPNPFSEFTQIHVKSREEGRFELRVVDMLGQVVRREVVALRFGENIIDFDGRELADGLYVYTISNGRGGVTGKMVVNHGRR